MHTLSLFYPYTTVFLRVTWLEIHSQLVTETKFKANLSKPKLCPVFIL